MTVKFSPWGNQQFFDENGDPAVGWKIYTYVAGSATPLTTYTTSAGSVAQTNPIILDSLGFPETGQIWLTSGQTYKLVLTDENDVVKKTEDNISGTNDTSVSIGQWISSGVTPTYVSATSFTVAGDQTTEFHVGRVEQFTVTAGTVYGIITNSVFGALTTVTMRMFSGQALDSGLSAVNHSILRADNPAIPTFTFNGKLGSNITAAATTDLTYATNNQTVTGDTGITAITLPEGYERTVRFTGMPVITYGASLIGPGQTSLQVMAGDFITFLGYSGGIVRITNVQRLNGSPVVSSLLNDFRLSLETGVPVSTTNQTSKTSISLVPYKGNRMSIYDTSTASWSTYTSGEVTLTVPSTTNQMYDVLAFVTGGVLTLQAVAWTNDTTRAVALGYQDGVLVRPSNGRRYLGSFRTTGVSGNTEDSEDKRFLWNYYHRVNRFTRNPFSANRTTTSASLVELNTEIRNELIIGVSEDVVQLSATGSLSNSGTSICYTALGVNGTTAQPGGTFVNPAGSDSEVFALSVRTNAQFAVGYSYVTLLGSTAGGTVTFYGHASDETQRCTLTTALWG